MFFGCNQVTISNPANFSLSFNPIDAVKTVSKSADSVPIRIAASHADFWRQRSQSEVIFDYDWTYTPQSYHGAIYENNQDTPCSLEIDYNRLKQQDEPILFFEENILYEDELGDNGISIISVKLVKGNCICLLINLSVLCHYVYPLCHSLYITLSISFSLYITLILYHTHSNKEGHGLRFLRPLESFLKSRPSNLQNSRNPLLPRFLHKFHYKRSSYQ